MTNAVRIACAAASLWLAAASMPAVAADKCPPLAIYAQVNLVPINNDSAFLVPVDIGGVTKLMLLDTGSSGTLITAKGAADLGLEQKRSKVRLYDVTGNYSDTKVTATIGIGALKGPNFDFHVAPAGVVFDDPRIVGLLGDDVLGQFDVSIDFPKRKLDIISQNHCDGRVVYWKDRPVAIIPFHLVRSTLHIVLPVTLDGHSIKAFLDTGASRSTLNRHPAENIFGLKLGSADTPAAGTLNGEKGSTVWHHTFKTLTFEGVTVANPTFSIIPDRVRKHIAEPQLGSLIARTNDDELEPDILLGMDVLKHLHVYIAYKERKLYITPSAPAAQSGAKPD